LAVGSFLPRSFYSPPRISWKLWWIPFWINSINNCASLASAFSLPPKLKGYTYKPKSSHNQLSLPTVNSFFARTADESMAPSPRATRTATRSSSSSSTPLDDQEVTKEKKKRKVASPKAASPVKEKSPSKVKGKQASDNTDTAPESTAKKAKKTSAPKHQVLTERDEIPKLWDSDKAKQNGSYSKSNSSHTHRHCFSAATYRS
jgi:hypothetical protein